VCRPSGPDRNAFVYDAEGALLRAVTLGDDIQHLQVNAAGDAWVGYGDEGVFGAIGWGGMGTLVRSRITRRWRIKRGPEPIAGHGIVRFDADLRPCWSYPYDSPFGSIASCDALNVTGAAVWACNYPNDAIIQIANDSVRGWPSEHAQDTLALIAHDDVVALIVEGGEVVVGRLQGDAFVIERTRPLRLPGGSGVPSSWTIIGRGPELHVIGPRSWLKLALEDLLA
jgi:hypothetical protein